MIYLSGGKRLIGRVEIPNCGDDTLAEEALAASIEKDECIEILDAFDFVVSMMPFRGPGGEMGIQRICQCMPLDNSNYPAKLHTRIEGFRLLGSMQDSDREGHKDLVRQVLAQMQAVRLQRAGLVPGNVADLNALRKGRPNG